MPFLLYAAVLVITLFSVVIEMHALVEPTRHIERAALTASQPAPAPVVPRASERALPPDATPAPINPPDAYEKALAPKPAAQTTPLCDVAACQAAYFTFTASDCTYQPSDGPRRICTKGNPPKPEQAANAANKTDTAAPKCNVEACKQAYFTFTPSDCTYQPSDGPRRLCTK
jgi:hypothetical protein